MKTFFFSILIAMLSAQMSFAAGKTQGDQLVDGLQKGNHKALALTHKYVFEDLAKESPELKEIAPSDLKGAFNGTFSSEQQKTRMARYLDGAIERSRSNPIPADVLRNSYQDFMNEQMNPSNPYYGFWSIMYNTMVAYQTMFSWPMWMMWGSPAAAVGGMYP